MRATHMGSIPTATARSPAPAVLLLKQSEWEMAQIGARPNTGHRTLKILPCNASMQISMFDFPLPAYFLVSTGEMRSVRTKNDVVFYEWRKSRRKVSLRWQRIPWGIESP